MLLLTSFSWAKCIDFDDEVPNFCVTLNVKKIIREDNNGCYFDGEVTDYSYAEPVKKNYEYYNKKFAAEKKSYLFQTSKEKCHELAVGNNIHGVISGQCHDNVGDGFFGLVNFIKGIFNKEDLYPKFSFGEKLSVKFKAEGDVEIYCPLSKEAK